MEISMNDRIIFMCSRKIISEDVCIYKTIMTLILWVHVKEIFNRKHT